MPLGLLAETRRPLLQLVLTNQSERAALSLSEKLACDLPASRQKPKPLSVGILIANLHGVCNVKERFRGNVLLGCHQVAQMSRRLCATPVPTILNGIIYLFILDGRKSISNNKWPVVASNHNISTAASYSCLSYVLFSTRIPIHVEHSVSR